MQISKNLGNFLLWLLKSHLLAMIFLGRYMWKEKCKMLLCSHIYNYALASEPAIATPTKIELRTDQFPLESLRPILARVAGEMQLQGTLSGKMDCSLDAQAQPQQLHFENVEAKDFQISSARYLGPDPLQVQHCKANGLAQYSQGVWQLKDLQIVSDVAALAGTAMCA